MGVNAGRAGEVVDDEGESGNDEDRSPGRQAGAELRGPERVAARERLVVDEVGRELACLRRADTLTEELRHLLELLGTDLVPAAAAGTELGVHAVQDDALQRHAQGRHLAREVFGVAEHLLLRARDEDQRRARRAQDLVGTVDARLEVLEEPAHAREEIRYLGERGYARRLLEAPEEKPRRPIHRAERGPPRGEVGADEPLDDLPVEEVGDPARRLEEVERAPGRW